jgi:predicted transglutaminase-like cysteine proteinase
LGLSLGLLVGTCTVSATASGNMVVGGMTSQPIGHYEFCKVNAAECAIRPADIGPHNLSAAMWEHVRAINTAVNKAVRPVSDLDLYGKDEHWAYPVNAAGDCEDYVLEKRRQLEAAGISLSNLLITVVRKPDDEGHAVLTLRTREGDFILDNLRDDVRLWADTGYRYLKRQSSSHTGRWVSLRDDNNMLVGAVKP